MNHSIDLNCDLGEGYGNDAELMKLISSANIACGYHAGNEETMRRTVELAIENDVAIGAHPSYPDRTNFGRSSMVFSPEEIIHLVTKQLRAIDKICRDLGTKLHHVKSHGALYNSSAKDSVIAAAIAKAVIKFDPGLILYGLSNSPSIAEAQSAGLRTAREVFADRTFESDGSLTHRSVSGSVISHPDVAVSQVLSMVKKGVVISTSNDEVPIVAETLCIHGDGPNAVTFASAIRSRLINEGISIRAPL